MWLFKKKIKETVVNVISEEQKARMMQEASDSMVKGITAVLLEISKGLNINIDKKFLDLEKLLVKPEKVREVVQGEEATVYGFYCVRRNFIIGSVGSMLIIVVAKDPIEANAKTDEIMIKSGYVPSEWDVLMRNNIDILVKGDRVKDKEDKRKESNSEVYISHLLYARDKFTDTPYEKAAITRIINKIKQKYAISNPVK